MIICGQQGRQESLNRLISSLADDPSVVVIAENLSNLYNEAFIDNPDQVLAGQKDPESLAPDLIITFGGPVVSKRLKLFLRNHKPALHWRIDTAARHYDTYQSLTHIVPVRPVKFFEQLTQRIVNQDDYNYREAWATLRSHTRNLHQTFLQKAAFSDLKVFEILLQKIPGAGYLHLGNSSPVRYAQFFASKPAINYYANRGTSGIDGCLSTAAGAAMISNSKPHTIILGDLSFVYDSNAQWNKDLPDNLRMVVINNQGGGIFRMIDGPSGKEGFSEFFETKHPVSIRKLAEAFGLQYLVADDEQSLNASLNELYRQPKAALLEVQTPGELSAAIYKNYLNFLKE
jgi:2-succinyl-5-enolpyruvyl-6-hydroxy-3-cyclohexene-1-carboxylate synthase